VNRSKRKGTAHEVRVRDYLNRRGAAVVRLGLAGAQDAGDLYGIPGWTIECKNTTAAELATAVDEALREQRVAGTRYACVIKHRAGANVRRAYVFMELAQWADLIGLHEEEASSCGGVYAG
jgi:hypothetical protein